MDIKKKFREVIEKGHTIALASATDNMPHVRIVCYHFDVQTSKLYFSSFKDNDKVTQFTRNNVVAFTTTPLESGENIRVKEATVTLTDMDPIAAIPMFAPNNPEYESMAATGQLIIYEVEFAEAFLFVPPDMNYYAVTL